jgi:putative transposase
MIKEATLAGARRHKSCELLGLTLRTLERWEKQADQRDRRKLVQRKPVNKLTTEQHKMVLAIANSKEYCNLPPSKLVPLLADEGRYIASESTFYRILRAEGQLVHRQASKPARYKRPATYVACGPNQVWSWDISYLPSQVRGLYYYLYFIMDIYSRKIVGWSIHYNESGSHAARLIKQACLDENVSQDQLVLHSDNGASMKGLTMLTMLQELGVIPSFSRPSVSNDNPYSEALFKTAKYHHTYPRITLFASVFAARAWGNSFVNWYNNEHLHSALKFVTPEQRHSGADDAIRMKRSLVYQMAQQQHPERWSGNIRDWSISNLAQLNPNKSNKQTKKNKKTIAVKIAA